MRTLITFAILAALTSCEPVECLRCEHAQTGHINEICSDHLAYPDLQLDALRQQMTASGYICRTYEK